MKAIFDAYGEFGLKNGIKNEHGQVSQKYVFLGNSDKICNNFFGTTHFNNNAFEQNGSDLFGSLLADSYNGKLQPKKDAPSNVEVTVQCSIAEFYRGSVKQVFFNRTKIGLDGRTYSTVSECQNLQVKPGDPSGTSFTFKGKGNEEYGHPRSDLVIKLAQAEEKGNRFARSGDNLIYTHSITMRDSFNSSPIQIRTLDDRLINLNIDQYITPQTVHEVKGEGMPKPITGDDSLSRHLDDFSKIPRGNLYVKFNIIFPKDLSSE